MHVFWWNGAENPEQERETMPAPEALAQLEKTLARETSVERFFGIRDKSGAILQFAPQPEGDILVDAPLAAAERASLVWRVDSAAACALYVSLVAGGMAVADVVAMAPEPTRMSWDGGDRPKPAR